MGMNKWKIREIWDGFRMRLDSGSVSTGLVAICAGRNSKKR